MQKHVSVRPLTSLLPPQRVYLYLKDEELNNMGRHVRRVEMLISYLHEIGHVFITFLAIVYARNLRARTPPECGILESVCEAGHKLERTLLGGVYWRLDDHSGRERGFMVRLSSPLFRTGRILHFNHHTSQTGLPGFRNEYGLRMVSVESIVKLADPDTDCE